MSYILDALRKSETERRQGRVPDLGQQVQLIHKPKKKSSMVLAWIGAGLLLNAAVLAYVFWPVEPAPVSESHTGSEQESEPTASQPAEQPSVTESEPEQSEPAQPESVQPEQAQPEPTQREIADEPDPTRTKPPAQASVDEVVAKERPTIIVPSSDRSQPSTGSSGPQAPALSAPHLVELPLAFQKSIPDLIFNSHIYGSEPSSRRVMINNNYLKAGQMFDGIRVEQITEQGVVLSKGERRFRVGIVRDWVSPK